MTDALATDINGRPIKAGDQCVIIKSFSGNEGRLVTIIGPCPIFPGAVEIDVPAPSESKWDWHSCHGWQLQVIQGDNNILNRDTAKHDEVTA